MSDDAGHLRSMRHARQMTGACAAWSVEDRRGLCVLRLRGTATGDGLGGLRGGARAVRSAAARIVVVDVTGVREIGSDALGLLLDLQARLGSEGRRLYLMGGSPGVRSVLARTRLKVMLPWVRNVKEAGRIAGRA